MKTNNNILKQIGELYVNQKLIEHAKKDIMKRSVYDWYEVKVINAEQETFTPFDQWLDGAVGTLPTWLSYDMFVELFDNELNDLYALKCDEAMKEYMTKENGSEM